MTTATPWYLYPISKTFNGGTEKGVDLKVPYGTNVTPLFPGTVTAVDTGPYGQEVDVAGQLNGQNVTASYVHLDQATVMPGQQVNLGSSLGWSGGQLSGGYHPASPAYSSGPHIEFSLWPQGTTPYVGRPYNPMSYITAVQQAGGPLDTSSPMQLGAQAFLTGVGVPGLGSIVSGGGSTPFVNIQMPNYLSQIMSGLGVASLPDLAWRVGLIVVGVVLVVIVAQTITGHAISGAAASVLDSPIGQAGERAAGRAAKA